MTHIRYLPFQRSFFKQFYGSVTKDDYIAMRLGFLMVSRCFLLYLLGIHACGLGIVVSDFWWFCTTILFLVDLQEHFRGNREYNFYDYMIKALEKDYKRVVGIK